MEELTIIILTREESEKLDNCIKSAIKLTKNIVVLIGSKNSGSSSEKLAIKYSAKVIKHDLEKDFSKHRNFALKYVRTKWMFYIDDDERFSEELIVKIKSIINSENDAVAFAIPRKNIIFGREFRHSGQWPDYVIRLFKVKNFVKYEGEVHEQPKFNGGLVHLNEPLIHLKHDELSSMVDKTNNWSEIEAKLMFDSNHPPMNIARFMTAMWREFFLRVIRQKAFLDGKEGIIYAFYQVFSRFISYAKLWEMQIKLK